MIVYSWNMLYRNRQLDRAFAFIAQSDFDIFCLQEVPETFLKRLQTLPCEIAYRVDVERLSGKDAYEKLYLVILSKYPIGNQGEVPFPEYWPLLPLRTRLFVHLMPSRFFTRIRNRGGLYADVTVGGASFHVFNLHLILAQPLWRLREFETAMTRLDRERPAIVCGDFNILEKPHITPLNWILGGRLRDAALYGRERTHIEERFVEHELHNVLSGNITHPLSRSQLDHILVSRTFAVQNAAVIPNRFGSDHHPIRAEVALTGLDHI